MTRYKGTARNALAVLTAVLMVTSVVAPAAAYPSNAPTVDPGIETSSTDGGLDAQSSHATDVTSCTDITSPGVYEITQDIVTTNDATCIDISADNVTLDGNGHEIKYNISSGTSYTAVKAGVNDGLTNVTVTNMTVRYFGTAVRFFNVSDGEISDVVSDVDPSDFRTIPSQALNANGIVLVENSDRNVLRNNGFYSIGGDFDTGGVGNGIYVESSDNNTIVGNTIFDPAYIGIHFENASDNNVSSNSIDASGDISRTVREGILLAGGSSNNRIADNTLRGNSFSNSNAQTGIATQSFDDIGSSTYNAPSDENRFIDNDVKNFYREGVVLGSGNATLVRNTISGSDEAGLKVLDGNELNITGNVFSSNGKAGDQDGAYVDAQAVTLIDNEADFNYGNGFRLENVRTATVLNNSATSNDEAEISLHNTSTLSVENLDLANYVVSFEGRNVSVGLNGSRLKVPDMPAPYEAVHYLEAGKTHPDGYADMTITYDENRVTNTLHLNESKLALWNHSASWNRVPEATVDTAANTVAVNLTSATNLTTDSLYGIGSVDDIAPTITAYNVTGSGTDLIVEFAASESLNGLAVEIRNGSGLQRTLSLGDFSARGSLRTNTVNYSATTNLPEGTFTVELLNATDDAGNNASVAKTASLTLDAFIAVESASLIDVSDGDGTVIDGDTVNVSATVDGTGVRTVEANATRFGGSAAVPLSDQGNGTYNGTFTVDADADDSPRFTVNVSSGTFDVNVSAVDGAGRTAYKRTNALTLDASVYIESASISDATDGDGVVTDGDTINVSATAGGADVSSFVANASDFGGPDAVQLFDNDSDGTYDGSFTVGRLVAGNGLQDVEVTLTNGDGRSVSALTNLITVDVSAPTVSRVTDGEVDDSLNASRVRDGDVVLIKVYATDFGTGLDRVVANTSAFGGPDAVTLSADGIYYSATFTVDAANARSDGNYDIPVTAFDKTGASYTQTLSLYMNNTGNADPPGFVGPTAENLDGPDSDVQDGDRINVSVTASDRDGGIDKIYANASAFGVDRVALTELGAGSGGTVYNATFTVDAANSTAPSDGTYDITIVATDGFGNVANTSTNDLTLNAGLGPDTTAPFIVSAYTTTPNTALRAVNDGTVVQAVANVDETGSGVASVTINATPLGAGVVTLTDANDDDEYNATFVVDAARASADGTYSLVANATDNAGNSDDRTTTDTITLDTTPPAVSDVTATNLNGTNDDVRDGDQVRVAANVSDLTSPSVEVDVPVLGDGDFGPISMSDRDGDGRYVATLTVDASSPSIAPDGSTVRVGVTATDDAGNTANGTTGPLVLNYSSGSGGSTSPALSNAIASDVTDGNGVVGDGDVVLVAVDVSDADGDLDTVWADAANLGGPFPLVLTDDKGDGRYDARFDVEGSRAPPDGVTDVTVFANDSAGNEVFVTTTELTLDTTAPTISDVRATNADGANDEVEGGDRIRVEADVADATSGVAEVSASADQFGVAGIVTLRDDDRDGTYVGNFTVNTSAPSVAPGGTNVSVPVSASDGAGNVVTGASNGLALNYSADPGDLARLASFAGTTPIPSDQVTPPSLAGKILAEDLFAANVSTSVVRNSSANYSLAITAPDDAENVTFYLQVAAISASQDVRDLTMYLDGGEHPFEVNESAGADNTSWVAFNVPRFSTRTVTFTADNETTDDGSGPVLSNATAIDREDGDGVVGDGDLIEVRVNATGGDAGINRTGAFPGAFGVDTVPLTPAGGDVYNATFAVDGDRAASNGSYRIEVRAEDVGGNVSSADTNPLQLNTTGANESESGGALSVTNATATNLNGTNDDVRDGDRVRVTAEVNGTDVGAVYATAFEFGVGETIELRDGDADGTYVGEFAVNASSFLAAPSGESIPVNVTATDFETRDSALTNALTLNYSDGGTTEPSGFTLISSSVTHVGGSPPSSTPYLDVFDSGGFPQIQLRTSEFGSYDLESLGVDHSTEFRINVTFNGTEPRVLFGAGRNLSWSKTRHANGSWSVSIDVTPASTQGLFPAPDTWDGTRQANSSTNETVQLALDPLSGLASERRDDLDGAIFGTDSQSFATPEYDPAANAVSVYVAAPHFTVNGANNTGFFDAFLPRDLLDTWGVTDPANLTVTAIGRDADPARVENTTAGARLFIPINYSAGDVVVSAGEAADGGGSVDDTPPSITNVTATNLDGSNDDLRNGDRIRVTATVSDAARGVADVYAGVARLGGPEQLPMADGDGDGVYEGTFTVNASSPLIAANGSEVAASVAAVDGAGNADSAFSAPLTLNYSTGASDTTCINRAVAGPDGEISLTEIQTAINWWAEDTEVPDTGGRTISLTQIQTLINAWAEDETVSCGG